MYSFFVEDEILDDEFEFSDEEGEEDKQESDLEDVGPVLTSNVQSSGKCEFEKDEALMVSGGCHRLVFYFC